MPLFKFRAVRAAIAGLMTLIACSVGWATTLVLTTHDLPPYSLQRADGSADGIAVQVVLCAARAIKQDVRIEFYPWKRAQQLVEKGEADGFFAASRSQARDAYATLTEVIAPQQWVWYQKVNHPLQPLTPEFKKRAITASFLGANMQDWLVEQGYRVTAPPRLNSMLLDMLRHGRIDAILANRLVMERLLQDEPTPFQVRSALALDKPLGIYLANRFLATQAPNYLARFNAAIQRCTSQLQVK